MELKVISDKDFERGYSIRGKLDGTFAEAEEFLGWVLDRNSKHMDNTKHFKEAIKVFTDKWNLGITTKYLRTITEDTNEKIKRSRIGHIVKRAGYKLTPTKRYFRDLRCIHGDRKRLIFGKDANGQTTIKEEKKETVGRLVNVFTGERVNRIMMPEEYKEKQKRIAFLNLRANLLNDIRKQNRFYKISRDEERRQEKAISKLKLKKEGFISVNCKECKHQMRIPLCPNIETDKTEQFISGIYNIVLKDIQEGSHLCYRCEKLKEEGKGWKKEKAINFLKDLYKEAKKEKSYLGFNYKDFKNEYCFENREIACDKVRDKIREFIMSAELDTKMKAVNKGDNINIEITKEI